MSKITLKGTQIHTEGEIPTIGSTAPDFTGVKTDLTEVRLQDLKGQRVILNIFPSIDTPTCAMSVRKFNEHASKLNNTNILCISMDLPFAQKRFCGAENLEKVMPVSVFRDASLGKNYGVTMIDGPLKGLLARAVIVINEKLEIIYVQLVPELAEEPDYTAVLNLLNH